MKQIADNFTNELLFKCTAGQYIPDNYNKLSELEKTHRQQVEQLETISGLSADEAKKQIVESLKEEAKTDAMSHINEIMDEAKMTANQEAKKIVIATEPPWLCSQFS